MNNNEGKNNSQGIFYAVIGVATLVVTIVGATFAFFSASASSPVNAVSTNSTTLSLGFQGNDDGIKDSLIPVDESLSRFPSVVGTGEGDCKDDNDNNICSVYSFTISNPSTTTAQRIYVTLTPNTNQFSNLHYAVFKGNDADIKDAANQYDVDGTPVTTVSNTISHIIGVNGDLVIADTPFGANSVSPHVLAPLEQVLAPSSSVTYTIVLYVHEIDGDDNIVGNAQGDQTSVDSGKNFAATISVTTANGGAGVTGELAVQGGQQGN